MQAAATRAIGRSVLRTCVADRRHADPIADAQRRRRLEAVDLRRAVRQAEDDVVAHAPVAGALDGATGQRAADRPDDAGEAARIAVTDLMAEDRAEQAARQRAG